MPQRVIELLNNGAEANSADRFRKGNVIYLPSQANLIITGDIHGHRRNFERITTFADLANNPKRHVILQEIIHGGPADAEGGCLSYKLLFDVIRYKLDFPDQVHIILGNHDTTFINNGSIMKNGKEMNRAICSAMEKEFKQAWDDIKLAMKHFFFSQSLAVKCENGIWASHSLPDDNYLKKFDRGVLDRNLKINDIVKPGSAYLLTWGRRHSQKLLDKMAELLEVSVFVLGHQPQEEGWKKAGENLLIISSEHNHGCLLSTDLAKSYTIDQLIDSIVPLASIS